MRFSIKLKVQTVNYDAWHKGEAESDLWLSSANLTLPLEFSLFARRDNRLPMAEFCQRLVSGHQLHPLFHYWLQLHGQRSMRGVRMNTLGWFDFKSAWFAPPEA